MNIEKKSKQFLKRFDDEWLRDVVFSCDGSDAYDWGFLASLLESFARSISIRGYDEGEVFDLICCCLSAGNSKTELSRQVVYRKLKDVLDLVVRKNHDYGNAVFLPPCCISDISIGSAILVRLSDKFQRFWNLTRSDKLNLVNESLEDTVKDIVGYLFLLWCYKTED